MRLLLETGMRVSELSARRYDRAREQLDRSAPAYRVAAVIGV